MRAGFVLFWAVAAITMFSIIFVSPFAAADCWSYTTETECEADINCNWHTDEWGGWCEELGCWNFWNETACLSADIPGKNCTWQTGTDWGWCEQPHCDTFDGTNQSACENNIYNLRCSWENECTGYNPNINCWELETEAECRNATGCRWGSCYEAGCWSYSTEAECNNGLGSKNQSCSWNSQSSYCYEKGCWDYSGTNQSVCENNPEGMNCTWVDNYYVHDSCEEYSCWHFDFTNQSACENNPYGLNCTWDGSSYCMEEGCWDYSTAGECEAAGCTWRLSEGWGWCEEVQCWTWDGWRGGTQNDCVNNAYGLNCAWESWGAGPNDGWCYPNFNMSCSNITTERECMETYYCFWQYTDWTNPALGGSCIDPSDFGYGESIFEEWNPGCYLFDKNSTNCNNVLGCEYSSNECIINTSHANANQIQDHGINCTMINESRLCNTISMLATCCEWKAGSCTENRISHACYDEMEPVPEGVTSCEDVIMKTTDSESARTLCDQIAGDPWYMPCIWDNSTKTCIPNREDIFGVNETQSCTILDNERNCLAAGCKWVLENYCEGNLSVPSGRCEPKGSDERNCMKACYACEYKFDGTAHNSTASAREYCLQNPKCVFTADADAPNGFGTCRAKKQFKTGIASDCTTDCGSCTYYGNPNASSYSSAAPGSATTFDMCNTPKCYCEHAYEFNNVKCKWIQENNSEMGGYCVDSSEKTCEDSCDRCYTQYDCVNKGRSAINATGSCEWSGGENDGYCSKAGETAEICWDSIDNDNDNLIDCTDPECFADSFCGFVSGDCFGWYNPELEDLGEANCIANNCTWMTDPWGSWCDFPGADCWKYDGNESACLARNATCEWSNGTGSGWCEQDWSIGEECYSMTTQTACEASPSDCIWTNDTYCEGEGATTEWCQTQGGWCEPAAFAPKNCWLYDSNRTACNLTEGCRWETNDWGAVCDVDWSSNCWQYNDNVSCNTAAGCTWRTDSWGSWCDNQLMVCWDYDNQAACSQHSDICYWDPSGFCEPICYNQSLGENGCNSVAGCRWTDGWCMEDWSAGGVDCWNESLSNDQNACDATEGCRWKEPGWCNPKGFAGGDVIGGMGTGAQAGMECWKYDGNESACTNETLIGMACQWMPEPYPFCEPDWSMECWKYDWNQTMCDEQTQCMWSSEFGYCTNVFEQCHTNITLSSNQTACDESPYCNWTTQAGAPDGGWCEPTCFSAATEAECGTGCRWMTGFCTSPGMHDMFYGMEEGPPVPVAFDPDGCDLVGPDSGLDGAVDICGLGMKDIGDAFGFGVDVRDFSQAGICKDEKTGPGMFGSGNQTVKLYIYLDTDGSTTGGCSLGHNSSAGGYEFMFKYISAWNSSLNKATEVFNAYKCGASGGWEAADITLSAWKEKMCSVIHGPMLAVKKSDLEKFPLLYDSEKDMRVSAASASENKNASSPSDMVGPGWVTPGAIDFSIDGFFEQDVDTAMFEDILMHGFVKYEDCLNGVDDDDDDMVDCNDWDCEFAPNCEGVGVNSPDYVDTSMPVIVGVKFEEYTDSALIMYETSKPTNGTVFFWYNDSTCSSTPYNRTIYDIGILSDDVREHKLWHTAEIYNDGGVNSLDYDLQPNTTYYYKIKICDSESRCSISACTPIRTASATRCPYCNFVTLIQVPDGWTVSYDLDQDGTWEHVQGQVCGPNAGMKTNYTSGRRANIKLNYTEGGEIIFLNVTLTKTGLSSDTRDIQEAGDLLFSDSETDSSGNTIGYVGMISETRDKIINNLHPQICKLTIPRGDTACDHLYQCDNSGENCIERTDEANLTGTTSTTCTWQIPYCEFSIWASGEPGTSTGGRDTGGTPGGGAAGASSVSETVNIGTIPAGTSGVAAFTKEDDLYVQEITITPKTNAENVVVTVKKEAAKPANVTDAPGNVFAYLTITALNIKEENITTAKIKFKVLKSWLTDNSIDENSVKMMRYKDNTWQTLQTAKVSGSLSLTGAVTAGDCGILGLGCIVKGVIEFVEGILGAITGRATGVEDYVYYQATTPGFSVFAITGEEAAAAGTVCTPDAIQCSGDDLQRCMSDGSAWETIETCQYGCNETALVCNTEEGIAPTQTVCSPGLKRCLGNELQQCSGDGTGWETVETCTYGCNESGLVCEAPVNITGIALAVVAVIIVIIAAALVYKKRRV